LKMGRSMLVLRHKKKKGVLGGGALKKKKLRQKGAQHHRGNFARESAAHQRGEANKGEEREVFSETIMGGQEKTGRGNG